MIKWRWLIIWVYVHQGKVVWEFLFNKKWNIQKSTDHEILLINNFILTNNLFTR